MITLDSSTQDIKEYSINYFTLKLHKKFEFLKNLLYCSFIVIAIDIFLILMIPKIFKNVFNIISLLLITFSFIFCLYEFRHNFQIVSYSIYKQFYYVIGSLIFSMSVYYVDMFYMLLFKVLLNFDNFYSQYRSTFLEVFTSLMLFLCYFILNLGFPIVIVSKLFQVKNSVKELGQAYGESYDSVPTVDPTLNEIPKK